METIKVRCECRATTSPYFTDGKVYEAQQMFEQARVYYVKDDRGHTRVIAINRQSPHFIPWLDFAPMLQGRFVKVDE